MKASSHGTVRILLPKEAALEHQYSKEPKLDYSVAVDGIDVSGDYLFKCDGFSIIFDIPNVKRNSEIEIKYKLPGAADMARVFKVNDYYLLCGGMTFIYPENSKEKFNVTISMPGLENDKFLTSASGMQQLSKAYSTTTRNLKNNLYLFGHYEVLDLAQVGDILVDFIAMGKDRPSDELIQATIKSTEKIVEAQNDFFKDTNVKLDQPLTVFITDNSNAPDVDFYYGAYVHPINGIVLLTNKKQTMIDLKNSISHECLHRVMGDWYFAPKEESPHFLATRWFTEGFTDYFAAFINHKYGMTTDQEYLEYINGAIQKYYKRIKDITDQGAIAQFYGIKVEKYNINAFIFDFPYVYGALMALNMDYTLTKGTKYDMEYFFKSLLNQCPVDSQQNIITPCKFTQNTFIETFSSLF